MDLLGGISVLIGFVALYGGFAYNKIRHESDGLDGSGGDSIIGAIIALFVVKFSSKRNKKKRTFSCAIRQF